MADPRDTRRRRVVTWVSAAAAPVLVVAGLTLVDRDAGPGATPARRAAAVSGTPSPTAAVPRPRRTPTVAPASRRAVVDGPPRVVVVPVLGIQAPVEPIEVRDGALTPPADPGRIGWWSGGARPGATSGRAVLTGHTVNAGGGAFDDLETLAPGARVMVASPRGRLTYEVTSVRVLSRQQLARENGSIFAQGGAHRLVLITCEDWDGVAYRSNVVVEAAPRG